MEAIERIKAMASASKAEVPAAVVPPEPAVDVAALQADLKVAQESLALVRAELAAVLAADETAEEEPETPEDDSADPEPEPMYAVGDKVLMGSDEIEITEVLAMQYCYRGKSGDREDLCAAESMLSPLTDDVSGRASDIAAALGRVAKRIGVQMTDGALRSAGLAVATGKRTLDDAFASLDASQATKGPEVPAAPGASVAAAVRQARMPAGVSLRAVPRRAEAVDRADVAADVRAARRLG